MSRLETAFKAASAARRFVIWTQALQAARKNDADGVRAAVRKIRRIKGDRDGLASRKLLRWAVGHNRTDIAGMLLERGADPDTHRELGDGTLLSDVVTGANADMARLLIKYGATVNFCSHPWRNTPLHQAVSFNRKEMVLLLLEHGADITIRDKQGETPLDLARRMNVIQSRRALEEYASRNHADQIKNVYKTNRKRGKPRPEKRRQARRNAALHL